MSLEFESVLQNMTELCEIVLTNTQITNFDIFNKLR